MSAESTPDEGRHWMTTKAAAAHLCCNEEVLRRWNRQHEPWLPTPRRRGRNLLWDRDELDSAIDACRPADFTEFE